MGLHFAGDEVGFYSGVIVYSITPNYYEATGVDQLYSFELRGNWLTNIPDNAIAWIATSNNNPTRHVGQEGWGIPLSKKSFNSLVFEKIARFGLNAYLGVITSADGTTEYYVNRTNPLPT